MSASTTSRPRLRSALPAVLALTLLLVLAGTSAQATSSPPATSTAPAQPATSTAQAQPATSTAGHAPTAPAVGTDPDAPMVVIGVAGLSWSDLSDETPTLARFAEGAIGSLVVRSVHPVTCPVDGWLALSSGSRAADERGPCRDLSEPVSEELPDWDDVTAQVAEQSYDARLGLLRSVLDAGQVSAAAIGPGAAVEIGRATGRRRAARPGG